MQVNRGLKRAILGAKGIGQAGNVETGKPTAKQGQAR